MKKTITLVIIGIFVLSGIGASSYVEKIEQKFEMKNHSEFIIFSEPYLKENEEGYIFINLEEANSNHITNGGPILPEVIKKYVYP